MGGVLPYPALNYGVDGFRFYLNATTWPLEFRPTLRVGERATEYCKRVCLLGEQSILFGEAHANCWQPSSGTTPDMGRVTLLELHIPSLASGDVPFDFCIEQLSAITNNMSYGDPGVCGESFLGRSCAGHCGESTPQPGNCYCDIDCLTVGDCCSDYSAECADSCRGNCGDDAANGCSCDDFCSFNDTGCCSDYAEACAP